ncbi:hypothetical protein [Brevibacterium marinum]|uniref:Uncharacterized protein n=1 Tax=Brevibacterium marinum TaxID=418643 RepID=A0A846RZ14_9MICO|nr:hypothetical protein [Brevibacterium marinum]NJC55923.1 hypothetical protein [Brevibacterium marinum]
MTEHAEVSGPTPARGRSSAGISDPADGGNGEATESARLAESVTSVAGVRALAPGLRDLVATATAKVLRRSGGEPTGVDVTHGGDEVKVRIDAHLDETRPVAEVIDEIFAVVEADKGAGLVEATGPLDIDLRIVSRG